MPGESQQVPTTAPDPTVLTTEQLLREVENATKLLQAQINGLKDVIDTKFEAIDREFSLIESRRVEQKVDTKVAVDAALSAAEKAVKEQTVASEKSIIKSETSAAEQSKQQNATFTAALKGVTDILADLKERVGKIEAIKVGGTASNERLLVIAGLIIAALAVYAGTR